MGIAFGILAGIFVLCVNNHSKFDHFTDKTYWIYDDGISYKRGQVPTPITQGNNEM
jgi:hypothetical protein